MTKESNLIIEISSLVRVEILSLLQSSSLKTSQIAKKTNSTVQGVKRHLERLSKAKLIQKQIDGNFSLTPIGYSVLLQIDFFNFFSNNSMYFSNHLLDGIPEHMIRRMGELVSGEYESNTMKGLQRVRNMIVDNNEWAHGIAAVVPLEFFDVMKTNLEKGVTHKIIFGKNTIVPKGFENYPTRINQWLSAKKKNQIEEKFTEHVPLNMVVTDNEALLVFFNNTGALDAKSMFFGKDELFRKWCEDLFDYFWNVVPEVPEFKIKEMQL